MLCLDFLLNDATRADNNTSLGLLLPPRRWISARRIWPPTCFATSALRTESSSWPRVLLRSSRVQNRSEQKLIMPFLVQRETSDYGHCQGVFSSDDDTISTVNTCRGFPKTWRAGCRDQLLYASTHVSFSFYLGFQL